MLFFQKNVEHIFDNLEERGKISKREFLEALEEINAYLPHDWRLTRIENNFTILIKYKTEIFQIKGFCYRDETGRTYQKITSIFEKTYFDQIDLGVKTAVQLDSFPTKIKFPKNLYQKIFYNKADNSLNINGIMVQDERKALLKLSGEGPYKEAINALFEKSQKHKKDRGRIAQDNPETCVPNLYFFHPRPDNAASPLFARQYEKVKQVKPGILATDQYHRIHPLTKDGLDLEHFLWVRWFTNGDIGFVDTVPPDYRGKDYWMVENMHPKDLERSLRRYEEVLRKVNLQPRKPMEYRPSPYEIEYKFLAPPIREVKDLFCEALRKHSLEVEHSPKRAKDQTDVYFDDERFTLHANGVSFRVRKSKGNLKATMKKRLPVKERYSATGLYERIEEEAAITASQRDSLFKGEGIKALPYRLLEYVSPSHGPISEKLRVENRRERWIVRNASHQKAEVFFDDVSYLIDGQKSGPFYEVEIESKGMPIEELEKLACYLEENLGLIPSRQSKYERGVSLLKTMRCRDEKEKKLVIIDTDCGVDDALALILALKSPELEVMAVTTVSGNVHVDKVAPNVFKVFNALGLKETPIVAKGAEKPLEKEFEPVPSVHGGDGLGDVPGSASDAETGALDERPAWEVIVDMAREHPKQITLITVGPMTNLAWAIKNDRDGVSLLKEVVAMGGVFFDIGNIRADAEFNVFSDPNAARIAVEFCRDSIIKNESANQVPLTFVGLDVTHKVLLRRRALEKAAAGRPKDHPISFIRDITKKYMDFYEGNEGLPGCYLHDPLAVAYVINPAFLSVEKHIIAVETRGQFTNGMIFPDDRPTRNPAWRDPEEAVIGVARDVEREAFEEFFFSRLLS